MRLRREIEVDWSRAMGGRVPILTSSQGGFEFNEPAVAVNRQPPGRGVIGWDPSLGWVLVLDPDDASAGQRDEAASSDDTSPGDASEPRQPHGA